MGRLRGALDVLRVRATEGGRFFVQRVVLYFVLSASVLTAIVFLFEHHRFDLQLERLTHEEQVRVALTAHALARNLQDAVASIRTIARLQEMQDFADNRPGSKARLESELSAFAEFAGVHDQIRFLDPAGRERVRVNFANGVAATADRLQDKSDRYYYLDMKDLQPGEVYVSPLDLNIEYGRIEQPINPVLRTGVAISDSAGRLAGYLVLNTRANELLLDLDDMLEGSWGVPMLLNRDGYWLRAPSPDMEWGFQLPHGRNFAREEPVAWRAIRSREAGIHRSEQGWFVFATLRPYLLGRSHVRVEPGAPVWKIVTRVPPEQTVFSWGAVVDTRAELLLGLLVLVGGLTVPLAWFRTASHRHRRELAESERRLAEAQQVAHVGSWYWESGSGRLRWSDETFRIFGLEPRSIIPSYDSFVAAVHPDDRERVKTAVEEAIHNHKSYAIEHRIVRPDGAVRTVQGYGIVEGGNNRKAPHLLGTVQDITEARCAKEQLFHLAHHDTLTGLPNRLLFNLTLEKALQRAQRHDRRLALLYLDLDRFKRINDTLGHHTGDLLLQAVAERLQQHVRSEDTIARLSGDEFAVIAEEIHHENDAAALARKLRKGIGRPLTVGGREVVPSVSIGISLFPEDACSAADLARTADTAMYRAKENGRNRYEFYTPELTVAALRHLDLEHGLRQALFNEEFELRYQPQVDLDGRLVGAEALLRWRHPELGLLSPDTFVHIAEDTGLILPIGVWVLRTALAQMAAWRAQGLPPVRMSVNVSGHQVLRDHFVASVAAALAEFHAEDDPCLELEITESTLQTGSASVKKLEQLRRLGLTIAIDDFGTGFSSLGQLKHMPVDTLKIPLDFVRNIPRAADDTAIAATIVAMARTLRLNVVAEGVEDEAQLRFLREQDCDVIQGFIFSEAVTADVFTAMLREGTPLPVRQRIAS